MFTAKKTMRLGLTRIFFWTGLLFGVTLTDSMVTNAGAESLFEIPLFYFSRAGCGFGRMETGTWTETPLRRFNIRHRVTSFHYYYLEILGLNGPTGRWVRRDLVRSPWRGPKSGPLHDWRAVDWHSFEYADRPRVRGNHWARGNVIGGRFWKEGKTDVQTCFSPPAE